MCFVILCYHREKKKAMDVAVSLELDEKYKILRRTFAIEDFDSLKRRTLRALDENPGWRRDWVSLVNYVIRGTNLEQ